MKNPLPPLPLLRPNPKGVRTPAGRLRIPVAAKTPELTDLAVSLRTQGYTIAAIARHVGTTDGVIAKWLSEEWDRLPRTTPESKADWLARELEKLELLELQFAADAMKGKASALGHVLAIMDRRAKYLGLYAPKQQEHKVDFDGTVSFGFKSQAEIERDLRAAIEKRKADHGATDPPANETALVVAHNLPVKKHWH